MIDAEVLLNLPKGQYMGIQGVTDDDGNPRKAIKWLWSRGGVAEVSFFCSETGEFLGGRAARVAVSLPTTPSH